MDSFFCINIVQSVKSWTQVTCVTEHTPKQQAGLVFWPVKIKKDQPSGQNWLKLGFIGQNWSKLVKIKTGWNNGYKMRFNQYSKLSKSDLFSWYVIFI